MNTMTQSAPRWMPYRALRLNWSSDDALLEVTTPWLALEVEVEPDRKAEIEKFRQERAVGTSLEASRFLEHFKDYPLANWIPRAREEFSHFENSSSDPLGPNEVLDEASSIILETSQIAGTDFYDPVSVFTRVRELRLTQQYSEGREGAHLAELRQVAEQDESRFLELTRLALTQTYAVTSRCEKALAPALKWSSIRRGVEAFMRAEHGHHHLIASSLAALGVEHPEVSNAFSSTHEAMDLLEFAAGRHPIAFACVIGAFEGDDLSQEDPWVPLLERSKFPQAAEGLRRHHEINLQGNHAAIGGQFAKALGPVPRSEVLAAVQLSKRLTSLQQETLERLFQSGVRREA